MPNHGAQATVTTVFAGPWVGEFGWELFCWQGYLRSVADQFDRVIVCSRPGHEALYEDFADEFVPFDPPPDAQPDCHRMHGYDGDAFSHLVPEGAQWMNPWNLKADWSGGPPVVHNQKFIQFGKATPYKYDILIHARGRRTCSERNWSRANWLELYASLPHGWTVGWVGLEDESMAHPAGDGLDLRSVSLSELIHTLRAARMVIGPSSGPIHLAALCGTPHVVWSGSVRDVPRYRDLWNPFNVSHTMLTTWQPKVSDVLDSIVTFGIPR